MWPIYSSGPAYYRGRRRDSEMRWIRRNSRFGSWTAIFALAIQLVLSFGHIHFESFQDSSAVIASSSQPQSNTSDDDELGAGHKFCAICVALNLTSSSVLPSLALPATPVDHPHKWVADLRPAQVSYSVYFLFQPRAPPHSV
jgi:hypothetical protein